MPEDLENSIRAEVDRGQFASMDEAIAEAARLLLREIEKKNAHMPASSDRSANQDPVLGAMREGAEELDEIVSDAMKRRSEGSRAVGTRRDT
ncbi:hypothetical protein P12x_005583 [Tundrisphaera lichenicola]|uniref:hypothetical protein n=1 Tax=Tundrisphaera lichenicola TaxID=2029860 RepID=UPI003EBF96EC